MLAIYDVGVLKILYNTHDVCVGAGSLYSVCPRARVGLLMDGPFPYPPRRLIHVLNVNEYMFQHFILNMRFKITRMQILLGLKKRFVESV